MGFSKFELDSVCHVGVTLPIHAVSPLSLQGQGQGEGLLIGCFGWNQICGSELAREGGGSVDVGVDWTGAFASRLAPTLGFGVFVGLGVILDPVCLLEGVAGLEAAVETVAVTAAIRAHFCAEAEGAEAGHEVDAAAELVAVVEGGALFDVEA